MVVLAAIVVVAATLVRVCSGGDGDAVTVSARADAASMAVRGRAGQLPEELR